ncbi:MAG TPA: hypothetical protein VFS43_15345 [Polyangiaceae bacterium]|nr:hypothetical protein [Polyangiaceae bacterium]
MFALRRLVDALVAERVAFVILGGVALTMQGSARALERTKRAAGRANDLLDLETIAAIREERDRG